VQVKTPVAGTPIVAADSWTPLRGMEASPVMTPENRAHR
jgi:hypothetical protein